MTVDLLRAFSLAFGTYRYAEGVEILDICPEKLCSGSHDNTAGNRHSKCGVGHESKYDTEILVWGEVCRESILCRWKPKQIRESCLLDVLPSLGEMHGGLLSCEKIAKPTPVLRPFPKAKSPKIAEVLKELRRDPCAPQAMQVFLFLLGRANGTKVEKSISLEWIPGELTEEYAEEIAKF